jgi:hypothetical protein
MKFALLVAPVLAITAVSTTAAARPAIHVGAQAEMLPVGQADLGDGPNADQDFETSWGFTGRVDVEVLPWLSVGAAPRLIIGIESGELVDSSKQLDLATRVTFHGRRVLDKAAPYAYLSSGYSMWFLPGDGPDAKGLQAGAGAGAVAQLFEKTALVVEMGYTHNVQSVTVGEDSVKVRSGFVHMGLGVRQTF